MRVWGHFGHPCLWGKNKHKKNVFDQAKKTDTFLKQKIWLYIVNMSQKQKNTWALKNELIYHKINKMFKV